MAISDKNSVAIIIFVRRPQLGKVKTRLAKSIGDEKALEVYKELLQHTLEITRAVNATKFIFYTDEIEKNDLWSEPNYWKCKQHGKDLGDRMNKAFSFVFQQKFKKVIIIGSDCYELTSALIEDAINLLSDSEMVIGPALDGGYYLLGMNKLHSEVFENKAWSTSEVAVQTFEDAERLGLKYSVLEKLSDIDEFEDLSISGLELT